MFFSLWNTPRTELHGGHVGISRGWKADLLVGSIEDAVVALPGKKRDTPHKYPV